MDTWTKSCSPTIVITANGEVHTHEEAIVYVIKWSIDQGNLRSEIAQMHRLGLYLMNRVKTRLEKDRIELKVIPLQCLCQVSMLMIERGHPLFAVNPITSKVAKPTKKHQKQKKETMCDENPTSGRAKGSAQTLGYDTCGG